MRNTQHAACSVSSLQAVRFPFATFLRPTVLCLGFIALIHSIQAQTQVVAWGAGKTVNTNSTNDWGQSIVPAGLTNAVEVAGGWRHSLAVKSDGTIQGWGDDTFGQIDLSGNHYLAAACGDLFSLALETNGAVAGAGDDLYGQTDVPGNLTNAVAVACGFYHSLALKSDGTLVAWGGTESSPDYEGTVPNGVSNVVAIAAGGYHNLVLKSDGTLFAWGENQGFGETNIPAGLSNVTAIAAGGWHNLALKSDGTVIAWGLNDFGQTNVPGGLSNVVAVAAGSWHSLALKSNGTVVAWGENTEGDTNVPANLINVDQIAAGDVNSLALSNSSPPITHALLTTPKLGTNGFSVLVSTRNGRVYQLEYKNALTNTVWQSLPLHAGTGKMLRLTDPGTATQRYYRVIRW
jgi:alpha-tubulin suppressor-like RCC1 family protein